MQFELLKPTHVSIFSLPRERRVFGQQLVLLPLFSA